MKRIEAITAIAAAAGLSLAVPASAGNLGSAAKFDMGHVDLMTMQQTINNDASLSKMIHLAAGHVSNGGGGGHVTHGGGGGTGHGKGHTHPS